MNNNQINNTDYYRLPCGLYLEDYIYFNRFNFAEGSALKYYWRAGHKDGESKVKDLRKCLHYLHYLAKKDKYWRYGNRTYIRSKWRNWVRHEADAAETWCSKNMRVRGER